MENDYLQSQSQYRLICNPLILKKMDILSELKRIVFYLKIEHLFVVNAILNLVTNLCISHVLKQLLSTFVS
jgi:hypothetical protein